MLIFLCPEAHTFAGFAKVLEVPDPNLKKGILGEHPNFRISWKEEKDCDLELTNKLKNSYDGKAPVRTSKEF